MDHDCIETTARTLGSLDGRALRFLRGSARVPRARPMTGRPLLRCAITLTHWAPVSTEDRVGNIRGVTQCFPIIELADRIEGALLGTMIGDALGRPFEGTPIGDIDRLRTAVQRRVRAPKYWDYTDDTEMMLAVATSILGAGCVDESHILATMATSHEPARGYGKGARAAFRSWQQTGSWEIASRAMWPEGSRGNGAAVRVAPVSIWHRGDDRSVVAAAARRSAMPTHCHPEAVDGAVVMASAVWLALRGITADVMLNELRSPTLADVDLGAPAECAARTLGHGVLAIESVQLALWAHCRNRGFEDAVIDAVSAAGDTDSIGAMTGAVAGATHGASSIPDLWQRALNRPSRRQIRDLATRLERLG